MCLVFASGLNGIANANEADTTVNLNASDFTTASSEINALMTSPSLFRGDFQQLALTSTPDDMYSGWGSRLMVSVMFERY